MGRRSAKRSTRWYRMTGWRSILGCPGYLAASARWHRMTDLRRASLCPRPSAPSILQAVRTRYRHVRNRTSSSLAGDRPRRRALWRSARPPALLAGGSRRTAPDLLRRGGRRRVGEAAIRTRRPDRARLREPGPCSTTVARRSATWPSCSPSTSTSSVTSAASSRPRTAGSRLLRIPRGPQSGSRASRSARWSRSAPSLHRRPGGRGCPMSDFLDPQIAQALERVGRDADERAAEIAELRRLPDDLADALIDTGALRLWVAEACGGRQAHPLALYEAIERAAYFEGSLGWVVMVCGTSGSLSGQLAPPVAKEIFADERSVVAGFVGAMGSARVADRGLRVTGRWPWGSGTPHCTAIIGGVRVVDEAGEPGAPGDGKNTRLVFFAREQVTLADNWRTSGLRGTASGDYSVEDAFVPEGHWLPFPASAPHVDHALYRFAPVGALAAGVASVCLGLAQRALHEIVGLAPGKTPQGSQRKLSERPAVQAEIAAAEAAYRAARSFLHGTVAQLFDEAADAPPPARLEATLAARRDARRPDLRADRRRVLPRRRRLDDLARPPAPARVPGHARRHPARQRHAPHVRGARANGLRATDRHSHDLKEGETHEEDPSRRQGARRLPGRPPARDPDPPRRERSADRAAALVPLGRPRGRDVLGAERREGEASGEGPPRERAGDEHPARAGALGLARGPAS